MKDSTPQQRDAIEAKDGPTLVIAGPGSGKTRVLTSRVAYLIGARDVFPYRIMAVTFTNKAAREMRDRVTRLTGQEKANEVMLGHLSLDLRAADAARGGDRRAGGCAGHDRHRPQLHHL